MLGLEQFLKRKPRALSGGQRQRVAMGRAIVREPQAFLMDEPLSNLDAKLRVQMRAEIARLQTDLGVTTIYVTHDQVEAMTMGDRVAVMRKGELQQVAAPQELYDRPVNLFVGGFIGSPAMNMVEASLERADGTLAAAVGSQRIELGERNARRAPRVARVRGQDARPRHPAGGPRGCCARPGHARRPTHPGRGRAPRGARRRDHGALHDRRSTGAHRGRPRAGSRRRGGARARRPRTGRRSSADSGPAHR